MFELPKRLFLRLVVAKMDNFVLNLLVVIIINAVSIAGGILFAIWILRLIWG